MSVGFFGKPDFVDYSFEEIIRFTHEVEGSNPGRIDKFCKVIFSEGVVWKYTLLLERKITYLFCAKENEKANNVRIHLEKIALQGEDDFTKGIAHLSLAHFHSLNAFLEEDKENAIALATQHLDKVKKLIPINLKEAANLVQAKYCFLSGILYGLKKKPEESYLSLNWAINKFAELKIFYPAISAKFLIVQIAIENQQPEKAFEGLEKNFKEFNKYPIIAYKAKQIWLGVAVLGRTYALTAVEKKFWTSADMCARVALAKMIEPLEKTGCLSEVESAMTENFFTNIRLKPQPKEKLSEHKPENYFAWKTAVHQRLQFVNND